MGIWSKKGYEHVNEGAEGIKYRTGRDLSFLIKSREGSEMLGASNFRCRRML